jgi:hypothetical protein
MLKIKNKHQKWTTQYVLIMAQGTKTKITSLVTALKYIFEVKVLNTTIYTPAIPHPEHSTMFM